MLKSYCHEQEIDSQQCPYAARAEQKKSYPHSRNGNGRLSTVFYRCLEVHISTFPTHLTSFFWQGICKTNAVRSSRNVFVDQTCTRAMEHAEYAREGCLVWRGKASKCWRAVQNEWCQKVFRPGMWSLFVHLPSKRNERGEFQQKMLSTFENIF